MSAEEVNGKEQARASIVAKGRMLAYEHAVKGRDVVAKAMNEISSASHVLSSTQYSQLNEQFQHDHLLYAARRACEFTGENAPADWAEFRRSAQKFYNNSAFLATLQGIYQEVITPILPAVYSEAVSAFADVVNVGFGETYTLSVGSNDIPIFQDSSWGAARSVPRNTFYAKDYTLNPKPKTAEIYFKYMQLIGAGIDFGQFFANIAAGMYAKTMGMWSAALSTAISNTALVPSGLTYTFDTQNWVAAANKVSALNNTNVSNLFATGGMVALSKVLPTDVTGTTNVNMDAAIATMLGADYTRAGYLGEYMAVRLMPLRDAVVPGTQNSNVSTILDQSKVYMMAGNGRKPMTIAMNTDTPISLEFTPERTSDFTLGLNVTTALDIAAVFSSRIAVITV